VNEIKGKWQPIRRLAGTGGSRRLSH
jgi:hypothetical protein